MYVPWTVTVMNGKKLFNVNIADMLMTDISGHLQWWIGKGYTP